MAVKTYGETLVNSYKAGDQFGPAITTLADGGYLVTWATQTPMAAGTDEEIYAQRYDASGKKVGGEVQHINTTSADDQSDPAVTLLNNGSYVISWADLGTGNVCFQRYSSAGIKLDEEIQIEPLPGVINGGVAVSALKNGGFVATWESADGDEEDATVADIYAQRFDVNGNKLDSPTLVNTLPGKQWSPSVIGLDNGGYLVVWESPVSKGSDNYNVYARHFDAQGNASGGETLVNESITAGYQGDPTVAKLTDGGYVIAWQGADTSQGWHLPPALRCQRR